MPNDRLYPLDSSDKIIPGFDNDCHVWRPAYKVFYHHQNQGERSVSLGDRSSLPPSA